MAISSPRATAFGILAVATFLSHVSAFSEQPRPRLVPSELRPAVQASVPVAPASTHQPATALQSSEDPVVAPGTLKPLDSLTRHCAECNRTLTPLSPVDPSSKLHAWRDASTQRLAEEMRVIVLLDSLDAEGSGESLPLSTITALEQQFAARAALLGFRAELGLENSAIVIGWIAGDRVQALAADPFVVSISPDIPLVHHRAEGGALMSVPTMRGQTGSSGAGVGVAIVDSGIDESHTELTGQLVAEGNFTAPNSTDFSDSSGHGTGVAGIVAGKSLGMAPGSRLWDAKVFDAEGAGSMSFLLAALDSLYTNRTNWGGLDIVNMSIGFSSMLSARDCDGAVPAFEATISKLTSAGILIFVSAGNEAMAAISYPACLSKVIAVGAVYDANIGPAYFDDCGDATTAADRITCYSNSAAPLDILAPSHCARTTARLGAYENCFGGTSAAAPYAAGVAALLRSAIPGAPSDDVHDVLLETGKWITDVTAISRPRVNAREAHVRLVEYQCNAQTRSTSCGATVVGSLESTDCTVDGLWLEFWRVELQAGKSITLSLSTTLFRSYLHLSRPDGSLAKESSTGSLSFTADQTGVWWIQVTTLDTNVGGTYQLNFGCSSSTPGCTATSNTFCTQSKRFEVKLSAKDPRSGKTDSGHVMSSSDFFGYFAFPALAGNTTDPQVFVKVLDGRPINGKYWVFFAALSDVEFTLTVRDTQTGAVKTYYQAPYTQTSKNDTSAF